MNEFAQIIVAIPLSALLWAMVIEKFRNLK